MADPDHEYWAWLEHLLSGFFLACYVQVGVLAPPQPGTSDDDSLPALARRVGALVPAALRMWPLLFALPAPLPPRAQQRRPEVWYVGIGSMMNQTALALRQIYPTCR